MICATSLGDPRTPSSLLVVLGCSSVQVLRRDERSFRDTRLFARLCAPARATEVMCMSVMWNEKIASLTVITASFVDHIAEYLN